MEHRLGAGEVARFVCGQMPTRGLFSSRKKGGDDRVRVFPGPSERAFRLAVDNRVEGDLGAGDEVPSGGRAVLVSFGKRDLALHFPSLVPSERGGRDLSVGGRWEATDARLLYEQLLKPEASGDAVTDAEACAAIARRIKAPLGGWLASPDTGGKWAAGGCHCDEAALKEEMDKLLRSTGIVVDVHAVSTGGTDPAVVKLEKELEAAARREREASSERERALGKIGLMEEEFKRREAELQRAVQEKKAGVEGEVRELRDRFVRESEAARSALHEATKRHELEKAQLRRETEALLLQAARGGEEARKLGLEAVREERERAGAELAAEREAARGAAEKLHAEHRQELVAALREESARREALVRGAEVRFQELAKAVHEREKAVAERDEAIRHARERLEGMDAENRRLKEDLKRFADDAEHSAGAVEEFLARMGEALRDGMDEGRLAARFVEYAREYLGHSPEGAERLAERYLRRDDLREGAREPAWWWSQLSGVRPTGKEEVLVERVPLSDGRLNPFTRTVGARPISSIRCGVTEGNPIQFTLVSPCDGFLTVLHKGTAETVWQHVPNGYCQPAFARVDARAVYTVPGDPLMPGRRLDCDGLAYVEYGPAGWERFFFMVTDRPVGLETVRAPCERQFGAECRACAGGGNAGRGHPCQNRYPLPELDLEAMKTVLGRLEDFGGDARLLAAGEIGFDVVMER